MFLPPFRQSVSVLPYFSGKPSGHDGNRSTGRWTVTGTVRHHHGGRTAGSWEEHDARGPWTDTLRTHHGAAEWFKEVDEPCRWVEAAFPSSNESRFTVTALRSDHCPQHHVPLAPLTRPLWSGPIKRDGRIASAPALRERGHAETNQPDFPYRDSRGSAVRGQSKFGRALQLGRP